MPKADPAIGGRTPPKKETISPQHTPQAEACGYSFPERTKLLTFTGQGINITFEARKAVYVTEKDRAIRKESFVLPAKLFYPVGKDKARRCPHREDQENPGGKTG